MKIQKKIARKVIFPVAMKLQADKILRLQASHSILNLVYHGVVNANSNFFSPRHITKSQFEQHLKYYRKNFEIISTREAFQKVWNKEKLKKKYLTLSFDDGFKNNFTNVLPLLEKYRIPVTFFVSGTCTESDDNLLWPEIMAALLYFHKDKPISFGGHTYVNLYDTHSNDYLPDTLKKLPYDNRDEVLDQIDRKFNIRQKMKTLPEEIWKLLTREDLIRLSRSSFVTIGSHGHSHFNLGEIPFENARLELTKSKELLESAIDSEVSEVAYPDGSYNETVKDIAEDLGYRHQFAVNYQYAQDRADPRIMNRHNLSSTTTFESNMLFLNKAFKGKAVKQSHYV